MSLYNMLFGRNGQSDLLLAVIGFRPVDVERFRDVIVEEDGKVIAIYTRTGGGNRPDYPQAALYKSPLFLSTEDDDFDNTYATFRFKVPEEFVADVRGLSDVLANGLRPEFGQHILKTLRREPTEADKAAAAYDAEQQRLSRLAHVKANGHTFVPFDDVAMGVALELAEANGGELRTAWGILPLTLKVTIDGQETRRPRGKPEYVEWTRASIRQDFRWQVDEPYWRHCQERFGSEFPVTMAKIAEGVQRYRDKAAG